MLGYLNQDSLLGGRLSIDAHAAQRAIAAEVAGPLRLSIEQAAHGIFTVVNANMVGGIRRISIEKGYDPRDFVLVVGGGAGPAHAGRLAHELGIPTILIPKVSSTFCAFGEILSDMKHSYLSSSAVRLDGGDAPRASSTGQLTQLSGLFTTMEAQGRQDLLAAGVPPEAIVPSRSLDMRYVDQVHECQVDIPLMEISAQNIAAIVEAFHTRHEELFTYCERDNAVEIMNVESTVVGKVARPQLPPSPGDLSREPLILPTPRPGSARLF